MSNTKRFRLKKSAASFALLALMLLPTASAAAASTQDPQQNGSVGLEGSISAPAPTQAATIVSPSQGQSFNTTPITVTGACKTGLLVKVFANNVFVGAAECVSGSYSLKVDLFNGQNDLVARVYDTLDQPGPDSNLVSVHFNDAQYAQFGSRVSLSSIYGRKGANPGTDLTWPIIISGGSGPYAVSIDWGDAKETSLFSEAFAGSFNATHVYDSAGVYNVVVKATDANGTSAYLQLVGVANGQGSGSSSSGGTSAGGNTVIVNNNFMSRFGWYLVLIFFPLLLLTFWLGSRHELFTIRRRIERSREQS